MGFPKESSQYGRSSKTVKETKDGFGGTSAIKSGTNQGDKGIPPGIKSPGSPPKKGGVVSSGEGDQGGYSNTNPKSKAPLD